MGNVPKSAAQYHGQCAEQGSSISWAMCRKVLFNIPTLGGTLFTFPSTGKIPLLIHYSLKTFLKYDIRLMDGTHNSLAPFPPMATGLSI